MTTWVQFRAFAYTLSPPKPIEQFPCLGHRCWDDQYLVPRERAIPTLSLFKLDHVSLPTIYHPKN